MSGYRYYEFVAIDKPLTDAQRAQLRGISTRARISATSFVNDYQRGDLKADPAELVERYLDAHLYLADWGTRRLMFRLPARLVDLEILGDYCAGDGASAWTHGRNLVLELVREDHDGEDDFFDETGEGLLSAIIPARAEWAAGDSRLLYLAWLCCLQFGSVDDDDLEPAVPPGLGELSAPLAAVADFLRIDTDLIAAAATASAPPYGGDDRAALRRWVTGLPDNEKDAILTRLVDGDPQLHADLLRRFHARRRPSRVRPAHPARTAGQLLDAAERA